MNRKAVILGALLLAAGGLAIAAQRRSQAQGPQELDLSESGFIQQMQLWTDQNFFETEANTMQMPYPPSAATNVAAALATLSQAEGTDRAGDPYRVCYGYKFTIQSFADHPAVLGVWRGETLPDAMCEGAGLSPGCVSTAAGKYQIIRPTWLRLKAKLGLPDFSPASQDRAAVELLKERGALELLEQGRFAEAMHAARKEWASLKGAGYGQGERSMEWLTARFVSAGGVLA